MKNKITANELLERYAAGERDFSHCDLRGVNLQCAHLPDIILYGATLDNADLSFATLTGADLTNVNAVRANFHCAKLDGIEAQHGVFPYARMANASLEWARLAHVNLSHAQLPWVNMNSANLTDARLAYANMEFATLTDAWLTGAHFASASLRNARFQEKDKTKKAHLNWNSHALLSEILYQATYTPEYQLIAVGIARMYSHCWHADGEFPSIIDVIEDISPKFVRWAAQELIAWDVYYEAPSAIMGTLMEHQA